MKGRLTFAAWIMISLLPAVSCRDGGRGETSPAGESAKPKIVIGLMVDQMRWDYLYKYRQRYGSGGFRRLLREGFSCENTFVNHAPTVTACGHSSVYTGSVPAINGIAENSWYDRAWGRVISNVEDTTVKIVGAASSPGRSPHNLLTTTIGDELRIATNNQSKVVGVAIKDRGAILPAGHTANGAFWQDHGRFVTSTYYMEALPDWAGRFNATDWKDSLMPDGWETLYPIDTYTLSDQDDKSYEQVYGGGRPVFPYRHTAVTNTPWGNTLTLEFARAAIEGYQLGAGDHTDMLAVSLSAPDRIGHQFGPNAVETEDNYLRLDKDLERFFDYLDHRFGRTGYLFFLTADHGTDHSPGYLEEHHIPTGVLDEEEIMGRIRTALKKAFGADRLILAVENKQIYLDEEVLAKRGLDKLRVAGFIAKQLEKEPGIKYAFPGDAIAAASLPDRIKTMYINGHHRRRSGDVVMVKSAGWKWDSPKGTDHLDWNPYDAHIPLVWMGYGITPGHTSRTVGMVDIAPTLAALLHIQMPSGCIGNVITEITD